MILIEATAVIQDQLNATASLAIATPSGGDPATARNSDDSFSVVIPSGDTSILPDISVSSPSPGTSDGASPVVVPGYSSTQPSVKDVEVPNVTVSSGNLATNRQAKPGRKVTGPSVVVRNTSSSYLQTLVPSPRLSSAGDVSFQTDDLVLNDVQVSDANGPFGSYPAAQNIILAGEIITRSGIAYKHFVETQVTSRDDYDIGWRIQNGLIPDDSWNPENPLYVQCLDMDAVNPVLTLKYNNVFGNLNRFTDDVGTQVYANGCVIDHLRAREYYITPLSIAPYTTQLSSAYTGGFAGKSGWFMCSAQEQLNITNQDASGYLAPFASINTSWQFWCALTNPDSSTQACNTFATKFLSRSAKTSSLYGLAVRIPDFLTPP